MAHDQQAAEGLQFCTSNFQSKPDVPTYEQGFMLVQAAFKRLFHYATEAIEVENWKVDKAIDRCEELRQRLQFANCLGALEYCKEFTARCLLDSESPLFDLEGCSRWKSVQAQGEEQYALLLLDALSAVNGNDDLKNVVTTVILDEFVKQVGSDRASLSVA